MMVDHNIKKKLGLSFVRLSIEVEMRTQLQDKIFFKNEPGELVVQKVQYDWKPHYAPFVNNMDMIKANAERRTPY